MGEENNKKSPSLQIYALVLFIAALMIVGIAALAQQRELENNEEVLEEVRRSLITKDELLSELQDEVEDLEEKLDALNDQLLAAAVMADDNFDSAEKQQKERDEQVTVILQALGAYESGETEKLEILLAKLDTYEMRYFEENAELLAIYEKITNVENFGGEENA